MDFKTVLFDFDGVLCKDRFYEKTLLPNNANVYDWIQSNIFANKPLVQRWMKGLIDSMHINRLIVENNNIDLESLNDLYQQSVQLMKLDNFILDFARLLKLENKKVGIVTDNMHIFTKIIVPNNKLDHIFQIIINSADYGLLKQEENGRLFDIALGALGADIKDALLIDDSEATVKLFKDKGGLGVVYNDVGDLILERHL